MSDAALIIFQKKPEAGKVKTRLAKTIGETKALEVYQFLLNHTHQQVALLPLDVFVYFEKEVDSEYLFGDHYHAAVQGNGDLGEKMKKACQEVLANGYKKAVIIGSDCPGLDAAVLQEAVVRLVEHDLVIGPAKDGGYYLIGMKKVYDPLFEKKNWSTSTVLTETLADAENLDLTVHLLKVLTDVDVYEDLEQNLKKTLGIN